MKDDFNGTNEQLCNNSDALLALDAAGALVPHGVGGHARTMLSAAASRLRAQPERNQVADDLPMLVKRLAQALRKAAPDHALPNQAMDYLQRKGLQGSPLRNVQPARKLTEEVRKFLTACANTSGLMVNGNNLSILANRILAAQPAAETVPRIDEDLISAAKRTRDDLGDTGDNYPDVRRLLSFAEAAISAQAQDDGEQA